MGYTSYIVRQTECIVVNQITVDSYALLFKVNTDISNDNSCKTKLHFVI